MNADIYCKYNNIIQYGFVFFTGLQGPVYQAMYDYDAQDDDEIGFIEGDIIINCQAIDEGWMFGTCRRTGQRGMLPANYVERIQ